MIPSGVSAAHARAHAAAPRGSACLAAAGAQGTLAPPARPRAHGRRGHFICTSDRASPFDLVCLIFSTRDLSSARAPCCCWVFESDHLSQAVSRVSSGSAGTAAATGSSRRFRKACAKKTQTSASRPYPPESWRQSSAMTSPISRPSSCSVICAKLHSPLTPSRGPSPTLSSSRMMSTSMK